MKNTLLFGIVGGFLLTSIMDTDGRLKSSVHVTEVEICWSSISNQSYQMQQSPNLTGDVWNNLGPPVQATGPTSCLRDAVGGSCRFYRVEGAERIWIRVTAVEVCWSSNSNLLYQIQKRSSNAWMDLGPVVQAVGPTTCLRDAVSDADRAYRVLGPDVVWIPPGTFVMGSPPDEPARTIYESPQTTVTISRGFWMGRCEVTQEEYADVMGVNPSQNQGANLPVETVSWTNAVAYCEALTQRERAAGRLPEGWAYRLPTEAEWEYACRAGTTTPFHYGNELRSGMASFYGRCEYPPCGGSTECCENLSGTYRGPQAAVGSYAPNAWGLYDMHGNVWEWCADRWSDYYPGGSVTDPEGPATGSMRVARGGSWDHGALYCRSASRRGYNEDVHAFILGFRVALVAVP